MTINQIQERHLVPAVLFAVIFILALAASPGPIEAAQDDFAYSSRYAINLSSTPDEVDQASIPHHRLFDSYHLYSTHAKQDGKWWYRLRLGFFPNKTEALKVMRELRGDYPEAWVTLVSKKERYNYERIELGGIGAGISGAIKGVFKPFAAIVPKPAPAPETGIDPKAAPPPRDLSAPAPAARSTKATDGAPEVLDAGEKRLKKLMNDAEAAITKGRYATAISLYKQVLKEGKNTKFAPRAQEYLGVARERSGDLRGARAEYKAYLVAWPEGPDAERVRQRLVVLETARSTPKKSLRKARAEKAETEVYGSFSQYYYRDENFTDIGGNVVTRSNLSTDMDVSMRRRTSGYDMRTVVVGGYDWDLLDGGNSQGRLSRLYFDYLHRDSGLSTRLGRQSRSSGGVLGRFDGALFGYQFLDRATLNLVSGFPTETSVLAPVDTGRYFYGASLDLGTFAESLDMNAFYIEQRSDGMLDRKAVGGEVRYFQPEHSFFSLVDYDTSYEVLNILLFFGNWMFGDGTIVNFSADYRRTPTLSTINALQGQTPTALDELLVSYTEDEIRQLALDRTALSRSYMVGLSHPLNDKFQVSGDFTLTNVTGTPASGGVAATPGTGNEYFYSTQLIGTSLLTSGDIAIIGLRYADTNASQTATFSLNTRYPLSSSLRVNPRFRASYSAKKAVSDDQFKLTPAMKIDLTIARRLRLELEGAMEWTRDRYATMPDETSVDYFFVAGYRYDF